MGEVFPRVGLGSDEELRFGGLTGLGGLAKGCALSGLTVLPGLDVSLGVGRIRSIVVRVRWGEGGGGGAESRSK